MFGLCLGLAPGLVGCASPFHADGKSSLARFEQTHLFPAARYPDGDWSPAGFNFEDAWFTADDGTALNGWYYPHEKPAAVVLFAHGNGGNMTRYASVLRELHDRHRLSIMIFDYRGYGKSDGEPDERGILQDARAARHWLAKREKTAEADVVLMGHSLGAGVMVDLAARDGARGLVLASAFTSLPDVAAHHYWFMPVRLMMHNRLDSLDKIGEYEGPLLLVHGEKDKTVPFAQGKRLFAAANEPKQFVVNREGGHDDPFSEEYHQALDRFMTSLADVHPQPEVERWRRTRIAQ
jgi:fermentation-respiration switch protein FrsA (DUF1100 family)